MNAYVAFVEQVELDRIWLRSARVTNAADGNTIYPADVSIDSTATWTAIDGGFRASHTYALSFTDGENTLGEIEVEFVVDCASEQEMTDELFELFSEHNLPLNTWPYLREFVASTTSRMLWMPHTLPTRRFPGHQS